MASKKCINIYIPKYFMAVRNYINTYIRKYVCTSIEVLSMVWSYGMNPSSISQQFNWSEGLHK